jgi:type I restriction enzyme S subunit
MVNLPLPPDWEIKTLDEIAALINDSVDPAGQVSKYIGLEHIEKYTLRLLNIGISTDISSKKFLFKQNDILFGRLRPYFRKILMPKFDGVCSTDIFVIRSKEPVSQKFLFYFLANESFVQMASLGDSGTKMPRADWNFLKDTAWPIPPLWEQHIIAEVLTGFDEKINLFYRQNVTLESLAETVFRKMFGRREALNWPQKPLEELYDITIGRTPPRLEKQYFSLDSSDHIWISIKDMGNRALYISDSSEYLTDLAVKSFNIPVIEAETVVLSFKMTVGRVAIATCDMFSNEAIAAFKANKKSCLPNQFLYFFLKLYNYDELGTTSTIATSLNTKLIRNIMMPIPEPEPLARFTHICDVLFNKIKHNLKQISILEKLRDMAIPQLMAGIIRLEANPTDFADNIFSGLPEICPDPEDLDQLNELLTSFNA